MMMKWVGVSLVWIAFLGSSDLAYAGSLRVGQVFPSFSVATLHGPKFNLDAERGKILIVHYWASWCSACKKEMALLNTYYQSHSLTAGRASRIAVIALSVDRSRDRDEVIKLTGDLRFPAAMWVDVNIKTEALPQPSALPVTYVLDSKGVVRAVFEPGGTELTEKALDSLSSP
jgi:peroxiredoxin